MARAYTVATAGLALKVSNKWLDNTLSHYQVQGVSQARQGVARRLSIESLTILSLAVSLIADLQLPLANALDTATKLIQSSGTITLPAGLRLQIDLERVRSALFLRLEHAVEVVPLPSRGRPPQKTTGRLD
jgi:hypothetical protein